MQNKARKNQGQCYPNRTPDPGFPVSNSVGASIKKTQIEAEHANDEYTEAYPEPRWAADCVH